MKALESRKVILHCSATRPSQNIGADEIRGWHVHGRGWSDIGYNFVIRQDGTIEQGRSLDRYGAHCRGQNDSIGICYVGGLNDQGEPADTMTMYQELAFLRLFDSLKIVFGDLTLHGHNEFAKKACPSFQVNEKFSFLYNLQ